MSEGSTVASEHVLGTLMLGSCKLNGVTQEYVLTYCYNICQILNVHDNIDRHSSSGGCILSMSACAKCQIVVLSEHPIQLPATLSAVIACCQ